jgi:hypothetical protein
VLVLISGLTIVAQSKAPSKAADRTPSFQDYAVNEVFTGVPAEPILATTEQRRYRTRIRNGVSKGSGVWNGSWKDPMKSSGPNFAGHYFVIRWGCGSNCLMMAVVDAKNGKVHGPPLSGAGTELYIPMDPMSDVEIDFRRDSSLMVLHNACKDARRECGIYYFNWRNDQFVLLKRVLVDLTKAEDAH